MNNTNMPFCIKKDLGYRKISHIGFTLAEMMVVMLIMSIILAAMAPVMTTRARKMEEDRINSTIWRYADNGSDIYYGYSTIDEAEALKQTAMIGQDEATDDARLIINTSADLPDAIAFRQEGTTRARLYAGESTIALSDGSSSSNYTTSIGIGSLKNNTGASNTAVGYNSLYSNTTGANNTALGFNAMQNSSTGNYNTAVGSNALNKNEGSNNIAVGYNASSASIWDDPSAGSYNVAVGNYALTDIKGSAGSTKVGSYNTAIGYEALRSNSYGQGNTAVGAQALRSYEHGYAFVDPYSDLDAGNTAIGTMSLYSNTSGLNNVAVGYKSLYLNHSNSENTAIGSYSISNLDSSRSNVAIGYQSLQYGDYAALNVAIGRQALQSTWNSGSPYNEADLDDNVAIGYSAMRQGGISSQNVAIGTEALRSVMHAKNNVAIGYQSMVLYTGTEGSDSNNVAIGAYSADWLREGTNNIAIGYNSMSTLQTAGSDNIAIGQSTFTSRLGNNNIAIGRNACHNVVGSNKICIGTNSGPQTSDEGTHVNREIVYIGSQSKFNGGDAVLEVHNIDETFKWGPTLDVGGYDINASGVVINGALLVKGPIIAAMNSTSAGFTWTSSNHPPAGVINYVEGDGPTLANIKFNWATRSGSDSIVDAHPLWLSDRRLKYVGQENKSGLEKIRQLKVFNYTFKKDPKKEPHVGVIAQDLQKIFPDAVKKGVDGFLTIRMEDMFYAVINAIKELDVRITNLEKENQILKEQNKNLDKRLKALEAKIK